MAKRLYIIGNGFDLHHNLKTSYFDFESFIKERYNDIYTVLEEYVSYPKNDKCLWAKFEENLANLDTEEILAEYSDRLPEYGNDEFRDRDVFVFPDIMEELFKKLTYGLLSAFTNFIQEVEYLPSSSEKKICIDNEAFYLTFNYTKTLEKLYEIPESKIVYIHNSAFSLVDKIILGHGIAPETFKEIKTEPPENLTLEELEEWHNQNDDYDYSYNEGKQNLMRYFEVSYKPTKQIINLYLDFFKGLKNIEEIFVLGHSISNVDIPYFEEIIKWIKPEVKWNVSYYCQKEGNRHKNTLIKLGVDIINIKCILLEDLQIENNQLNNDFGVNK
jgi:hypothetical protein